MKTSAIPAATPTRRTPAVGFDAVTFLTIYIFLFTAIPSYLTIPALGSIGRLSVLWGLVGIVWWTFYRVQLPKSLGRGSNAVKIALVIFLCSLGISYAVANMHGLPSDAATTADSSLLRLASWAGVMLVALDGVRDRERLNVLLHRFSLAGGLMALLGLAQFLTGQSLVDSISLPGFAVSQDVDNIQARGAFTRAAGTATHPLEYASLLCMALPLSLALLVAERRLPLWRRAFPTVAILLAVVLSVSRSALIGVLVGLLLLAPSLPARVRLWASALGAALVVGVAVLVPGLAGTLRGLFTSISDDPSTLSRTNSIDGAIDVALRNPFFGQGFGSFLPKELILDNQYLLMLIEGGIVGVCALLALLLTAMVSAWRAARATLDPSWKVVFPALAAGVGAATVSLAFFDGLSFPVTAGAVFVMVGMCGAALRIAKGEQYPHASHPPELATEPPS